MIPVALRTASRDVMVLDFPIHGSGLCSTEARRLGFATFAQIAEHVRTLPYGRVDDDAHGLIVLRRGRGTCSSKHKFLAILARECGQNEVRLTLGLYEMSERNTPGIGAILDTAQLQSLPEAHCYLTWQGRRYDFTGLPPALTSPFESLIEEKPIVPEELPAVKTQFHRRALARWAEKIGIEPDHAWELREQCIEALAHVAQASRGR